METEITQIDVGPMRVFQVENKVVLLRDQVIESYSVEQLKLVKTQALKVNIGGIESAKKAIIANETEPNKLYCAKNLTKFRSGIP